jgi:phosphatidylinositol glycan class M
MWYLFLLPLSLPSILYTDKKWLGLGLLIAWIAGQGLWLYFAYGLEHLGENTFFQLFITSTIFYFAQIGIMVSFIINR